MDVQHLLEFAQRQRTLVINIAKPDNGSGLSTIEPQRTSDAPTRNVGYALYDCLTKYDGNHQCVLSQAESLHIQEKGKVYIFTLRKNHWSDGSPVTAQDFENTWKYLLRPDVECPLVYLYYVIKKAQQARMGKCSTDEVGVCALDEKTLRVELLQPISHFLDLVSSFTFAPLHKSSIDGFLPSPTTTYYPVISNGPFRLNHWTPSSELILDKNPYFYDAKNIYLERIRLNYLVNDLRVVDYFLSHHIDLIVKNFHILFKHKAIKHLVKSNQLSSNHLAATCSCIFNCNTFPFYHKKLRKIFRDAIDKPKMLKRLTMMEEKPATHFLPPIYRDDCHEKAFSNFDLLKARAAFHDFLKEENISIKTLEKKILLYYPHTEFYYNAAEDLVEGWQFLLDIDIKTEPLGLKEMLKKMEKREFSLGLLSWNAYYHHPLSMLERFKTKNNPKNYCQWNTKEFTRWLHLAEIAPTKEKSFSYCKKADDVIFEDAPIAPIFYARCGFLAQPYVKNLRISPLGNVHFDELSFDQEMLMQRPFPERASTEELVTMLRESITDPLHKINWYGVQFTSPYEDYLCSLRHPDL